ncbi:MULTISPECIES: phage baseplate protein [unclassified Enterococcus]|uniref:phage baseplate protein n=1 Tax=unclassified Enterococcus TaxID=2608891 RepID=UPI003F280D3E
MADIVQLVENGVKKYTKTHAKAVDGLKEELIEMIYPVGSIYISVNQTNPGTFIGGTWERFAEGKTLFGASSSDTDFSAGKSGGSKTQELKAKIGIPGTNLAQIYGDFGALPSSNRNGTHVASITWKANSAVAGAGSGGAKVIDSNGKNPSNIPPYIAVYMWRRTA